jgi:hypothetical protein
MIGSVQDIRVLARVYSIKEHVILSKGLATAID